LDEALAEIRPQDANLIFTARGGRPLAAAAAAMPEAAAATILLGPEGGFTAEEIERAESRGFVTVSLGPRILKADTACLAACTLVQSVFGDMGTESR
ncbi:MAG: RsmE family RNA methyltransferase, partial [Desulfosudaceae bacterium]